MELAREASTINDMVEAEYHCFLLTSGHSNHQIYNCKFDQLLIGFVDSQGIRTTTNAALIPIHIPARTVLWLAAAYEENLLMPRRSKSRKYLEQSPGPRSKQRAVSAQRRQWLFKQLCRPTLVVTTTKEEY